MARSNVTLSLSLRFLQFLPQQVPVTESVAVQMHEISPTHLLAQQKN